MTAPRICDYCGAALDPGETCDCMKEDKTMADMEFVMNTDLETLPKTIEFNFVQLKGQLAASLEMYTGMVVTEDGIKGAKEDRARLNKLRDALEDQRKKIKKQCMAPYTDFEAKVKELVCLVDQPIDAIDKQLRAFEDRRRAEKRSAVMAVYDDTVGDLQELLPFKKLWRDEWYNTGTSMKKIRVSIAETVSKVRSDLEVLSTVESKFSEAVKIKYLERLDLNEALAERARLQERARKLREYEEQRAEKETAVNPPAEETPAPSGQEDNTVCGSPDYTPAVYRLCFECQVTREQAAELAAWLKSHNINYRRIK